MMLIFSALAMPPFRSIKLRTRRVNCPACGSDSQNAKMIEETDYVAFCGGVQPDWEAAGLFPGKAGERVSAQVWIFSFRRLPQPHWLFLIQYLHARLADTAKPALLVDVRTTSEFSICHLPSSHSEPIQSLLLLSL